MKPVLYSLILISVSCSALAQLLLKTGMSQPLVAAALELAQTRAIAVAITTNIWIICGITLYFLSAVVWLFVLARVEVSFAYPFVGLGFILTLLLGKVVMGDAVTMSRVMGTLFVAVGVFMIARD
jgi:multidrug transporter EmrE-like cation transporter